MTARAAGARALALRVLLQCRDRQNFAGDLLDRQLAQTPLNPADRRLATQLVYGVLRRRGTLDALIKPRVNRPAHQVESWIWEALRLGAFQLFLLTHIPPHAAIYETVELADVMGLPRAKGFLNGVLRSLLPLVTQEFTSEPGRAALPVENGVYRILGGPVLPDPAKPIDYLTQAFSLPTWLVKRWLERHGWDECVRLGFWFAGPAPITLRVNTLRCDRPVLLEALGTGAEPGEHAQAVRLRGPTVIHEIPGYDEGRFVVQDESAMQVAPALAPLPGEKILDLCAAPGGKTSHLAQLMKNAGQVVACDVEEQRLARVTETCVRLGLTIVEPKLLAQDEPPPPGPFDGALVDVPCSNTGVLGRRPEARWRIKPDDLADLVKLQSRLLALACERVRPGGRVVYSTCSIEPEENEQLVRAVLAQRQDLTLEEEHLSVPGRPGDGAYWAHLRRL